MERVEGQEMLDRDHWSPEQVACALCAIRRVNLLWGGNRMHKRLYSRLVSMFPRERFSVLEVASGHADVLQSAARMLARKKISLEISLLDQSALHLPAAADWSPELSAPTLMTGDALAIPLADNSVDVVSCCLFLHHLSAERARAFLQEALRVARVAVLVNDVERTRRNYVLSHLQTLVDPSELSRHDGPTSVRQAYTFREMQAILRESGCRFELERGFLFRLGGILWKDARVAG